MSLSCNPVKECGMFLSIETLLKSLFYKDTATNNCFYFSVDFQEIDEQSCRSYESAIECASELTLDQLVQMAVGTNECGWPVFKIIGFRR